jgi:DNA polymerase-3 subunit delta'
MSKHDYLINVIGHEWAKELLQRQHQAGRMPQSLLLAGPHNVGKSTLARYMAQYLNCRGEKKPCGVCISCRKVVSGNHPDVRIIDDDNEVLKIESIRQLQHELALSPAEGPYRVAVLAHFEKATASAANALLKTLEEPAAQVVIILTTPDISALLPTIVSRCQVVTLRPLPVIVVAETLQQQWHIEADRADLLAQLSSGRLGWAVQAGSNKEFLKRRHQQLGDLVDILRMHRAERLDYAKDLSGDLITLRETLTLWLTVWRDLLLLKSGSQTAIVNQDWQPTLEKLITYNTLAQIGQTVTQLKAALLNLDKNVNTRLNLEVLLLKLPQLQHAL